MSERETMSTREVIDGMNAFTDLMNLFDASRKKLEDIQPLFIQAVEGEHVKWFQGVEKVSDLDLDDAQGCLIVALSAVAQIMVKIRNTPAEEILKDLFKPKGS